MRMKNKGSIDFSFSNVMLIVIGIIIVLIIIWYYAHAQSNLCQGGLC